MLRCPSLRALRVSFAVVVSAGCMYAHAQSPASVVAESSLFAVEIRTGAKWDPSRAPQEQSYFREHSANLKRLRDAGSLVIGARYADKGLVLLAARSEADARAMMDEDPAIKSEIFKYDLFPFNVFYGGSVMPRPRPAVPQ